MKKLVAVVIPLYKEKLDDNESISLNQCIKVLGNHPIKTIAPISLNTKFYSTFFAKLENYAAEQFQNKYFENIQGYNNLLLSSEFYKRFLNYKYVLIYQLDAYVFRDELRKWCKANYDYIGAPWFENYNRADERSPFIGVGNGGFSLRKTKTFIRLHRLLTLIELLQKYKHFNFNAKLIRLPQLIKHILINTNETSEFACSNGEYEDVFWTQIVPSYLKNVSRQDLIQHILNLTYVSYKIAPIRDAIKFSFEVQPRRLYEINNSKLPFGCHAWDRYDYNFWKAFIDPTKD